MAKLGVIYKITNRCNGRSYIGQTIRGSAGRWRQHQNDAIKGSALPIHCAIRLYGSSGFSVEVLAETLEPFLDDLEIFFISLFLSRADQNGYNLTPGGGGMGVGVDHVRYGKTHSAATITRYRDVRSDADYRAQQAARTRELWKSPGFREKQGALIRAAVIRPAVKANRSAAAIIRCADPDFRRKQSIDAMAAHRRPEVRARRAAAFKDKEVVEKLSSSAKARWLDPGMRKLMSAGIRAALSRSDVKQKRSKSITARWTDPEYRLRQTEARKAAWVLRRQRKDIVRQLTPK